MERRTFFTAFAALAATTPLNGVRSGTRVLSEEFLRAVRMGNMNRVRTMLARDSSLVYARDAEGRSAYVMAHLNTQLEVANYLEEQGFLMDVVEATLARNWERIDEIGATSPGVFNANHPIGGTAMYAAALIGLGSDLWRLQQYGADPNGNPRADRGITPTRAAVNHPDAILALETTATLLGNGGHANTPQRGRSSVLHGAAATGNADLVRLVLRKGGDPTAQDDSGRTARDIVTALGHEEVARLLERHDTVPRDHRTSRFAYRADGTPYQAPDLQGYDPKLRNRLVGASHFDLETATEITDRFPLLATAISGMDEGAVEAAAHTGRREVASLLLDRGAPYSLPTAGTMGDLTWAQRLLDEDPLRVHERGAHDFALMWYPAIGGGSVEMAELFLGRGAPIAQEHLGTTALHFAVRAGRQDLTRFLLDKGADPNAVGRKFRREGETPLDHATAREDDRLVEILTAAGATRRIASAG